MASIIQSTIKLDRLFEKLRSPLEFSAPLLLRIFLAPIFIKAGYGKLQLGADDVSFFEGMLADLRQNCWHFWRAGPSSWEAG